MRPSIFVGILLCSVHSFLAARGLGPQGEQVFPKSIRTSEQRMAYLALQEAEQMSQSYPKLRVFASFLRSDKLHKPLVSHIWSEPSLYESLLWLDNFSLVRLLAPAALQSLAQNVMQLLYTVGNLEEAKDGELGRIFIKDYFRRMTDNPYPGQGSWLVLRIFLEPAVNKGVRRLRILYNAYLDNEFDVGPQLLQEPPPVQRSGTYPQKSAERLNYQYAYLIPHPLRTNEIVEKQTESHKSEQQAVRYRLSFIQQLHTQPRFQAQYSTAKS